MSKLGVVEDTLFVPMLGRIYASEHCPQILYDQKALELKKKPSRLILLPQDFSGRVTVEKEGKVAASFEQSGSAQSQPIGTGFPRSLVRLRKSKL